MSETPSPDGVSEDTLASWDDESVDHAARDLSERIATLTERVRHIVKTQDEHGAVIRRLEAAYWKVIGAATLGGTFGGLILLVISKLWK